MRLFVAETKAKSYLFVASAGLRPQLAIPRKELSTLACPASAACT